MAWMVRYIVAYRNWSDPGNKVKWDFLDQYVVVPANKAARNIMSEILLGYSYV